MKIVSTLLYWHSFRDFPHVKVAGDHFPYTFSETKFIVQDDMTRNFSTLRIAMYCQLDEDFSEL
jgi:hypothetical protein